MLGGWLIFIQQLLNIGSPGPTLPAVAVVMPASSPVIATMLPSVPE